jgi:hypothetical protein
VSQRDGGWGQARKAERRCSLFTLFARKCQQLTRGAGLKQYWKIKKIKKIKIQVGGLQE